jgi:RNA-directed DNA polymerase
MQNTGQTGASRNQPPTWGSLDWDAIEAQVKRLQVRIAKAVMEKRWGRAKALQRVLTHSFHAKALAVRKVISNRGARTPGIDNERWTTKAQKLAATRRLTSRGYRAQALRRIYILKKNGKKRPLSIPTMMDRAMQALQALALAPIAEVQADPNSYGFRAGRCCHDAIAQCFNALAKPKSARWVLEADIRGCFDNISHSWLLENMPMDKSILRQWLKCGYMEEGEWFRSEAGTPQGGIASPLLANLALNGLETVIQAARKRGQCINVIRYADDFIVTAKTPEMLTEHIKPAITRFLRVRGLELSEEKTKITSIEAGFDFLGQHIRKYSGTLRIQPAKTSVQGILDKVRLVIDKHKGQSAERLIKVLNPIIRGWAQYHRHSVCAQGFYRVDRFIGEALFRWTRRNNPKKSKSWIVWKHFRSPLERTGGFCVKSKDRWGQTVYYHLYRARQTVALRYRKVVASLHPFLAGTAEYFARRRFIEYRTYGALNSREEYTQGILSFQT